MPLLLARPFMLGAAVLALIVAGALGLNMVVRDALAQTDETVPVSAIETTPPVPGLAYPDQAAGNTLPIDRALAPGTPVVPADAAGNSGLVETGDGMTTNLGGSDVAVTSEGGSYEVDGPRRKGKRFPAPTPKP